MNKNKVPDVKNGSIEVQMPPPNLLMQKSKLSEPLQEEYVTSNSFCSGYQKYMLKIRLPKEFRDHSQKLWSSD